MEGSARYKNLDFSFHSFSPFYFYNY